MPEVLTVPIFIKVMVAQSPMGACFTFDLSVFGIVIDHLPNL